MYRWTDLTAPAFLSLIFRFLRYYRKYFILTWENVANLSGKLSACLLSVRQIIYNKLTTDRPTSYLLVIPQKEESQHEWSETPTTQFASFVSFN